MTGRHTAASQRRSLAGTLLAMLAAALVITTVTVAVLHTSNPRSDTATAAEEPTNAVVALTTPGASTTPAAPAVTPTGPTYPSGFDPHADSTTRGSSLWVVVNKAHAIRPQGYAPSLTVVGGKEVAKAVAPALEELLDAAADAGAPLRLISGYRSYGYQTGVYGDAIAAHGRAGADRVSARPGHSEHQTGLAVDVDNASDAGCQLEACFGETRGGRWVAAHAADYGFLIRYTEANTDITGYDPEPWHLRYVGTDLVQAMAQVGVTTLEEFFDVSGGRYPDESE